ncbi:alkene reductase [Streptomyces iconiensis]|uniref:Alkene reductase n=1 Tax=Streptomyces iconiensis TaxID=1384038 RepID=A0ABT6ZRG0_9ACTN|nr:alkene reductase [Streptomyces iconiensis]MDJ1131442.1 alkene reductase [Streptomyces iconiensis]
MFRHEQGFPQEQSSEYGGHQPLVGPVDLGDLRLPNRVVMAPLTRARATAGDHRPTALHAAYYGQRATAGLIVTEGLTVAEGLRVSGTAIGSGQVPGLYSERQLAAWSHVTDVVHALGGRIVAQLWHTGAHARSAAHRDTVAPRELSAADIARTVEEYAKAADHARRAGFDGVEIAANGTYLIAQFLHPRLNRRTDGYGTRRERLLLEITDAVQDVWEGRRVGVRLSPYWTLRDQPRSHRPRGAFPCTGDERTLAVHDALVAELNARPLAYLHLRGPAPAAPGADPDPDAFARYRGLYDGPLIANNGFGRETGNAAIGDGLADAVSFARHFIANPDLVSRFALGHPLASDDRGTHYTGGAHGYTDYPVWPGT